MRLAAIGAAPQLHMIARRLRSAAALSRSSAQIEEALQKPGLVIEPIFSDGGLGRRRAAAGQSCACRECGGRPRRVQPGSDVGVSCVGRSCALLIFIGDIRIHECDKEIRSCAAPSRCWRGWPRPRSRSARKPIDLRMSHRRWRRSYSQSAHRSRAAASAHRSRCAHSFGSRPCADWYDRRHRRGDIRRPLGLRAERERGRGATLAAGRWCSARSDLLVTFEYSNNDK